MFGKKISIFFNIQHLCSIFTDDHSYGITEYYRVLSLLLSTNVPSFIPESQLENQVFSLFKGYSTSQLEEKGKQLEEVPKIGK